MSQNNPLGAGDPSSNNIPLGGSPANANPPGAPAAGAGSANDPAGAQAQIAAPNGPAAAANPVEENKERHQQLAINQANDWNPQLVRSFLLPNNDRYLLENEHMQPLKAGSGLFGTSLIDLEALKREKCSFIAHDQRLHKNQEMLSNLRLDGIYVDDPDVHQKFTDINVQKLEERLLKNGQFEFFKMNGELKLDNDILDEDLTRPADLAFEQTTAFQTTEINAILSDRLHSFKKRYFRLDIILGNVKLFNCKTHLSLEDKKALELKEKFQDYETRISLSMIPFYMERLRFITEELLHKQELSRQERVPEEELNFLVKTQQEVQRSLDKEKLDVNKMANGLYEIWKVILEERRKQNFSATNVELKVHQDRNEAGDPDQMLDLKYDNGVTPETTLPSTERSRQSRIKKMQMYAVLLINDRKVSKTNKVLISWPTFNFSMKEIFQVHVFTIPSSIKVELILCDGFSETIADVIKVEVPGQHVKALTCSCALIQKFPFSKVAFENSKVAKKFNAMSYKPDGELSEKQRNKMKIEQEKKAEKDQLREDTDIKGEIFIKIEWKGDGPKMPPIRSENLFKKPMVHKNRKKYTAGEEMMMLLKQLYIDVNDPRNQHIIKVLRETKNEFLVNLLRGDSKNLMADAQPFRHKLLAARSKDVAGFGKVFVPMLESELIDSARSSFYLDKLEELFRNEAYMVHLKKMVNKQKEAQDEGKEDDFNNLFSLMDLDTLRRRQMIFDQIKERQQQHSNESMKGGSTYASVVEEEMFSYDANFLLTIANKLFMRGRKLKPLIREQPTKNLELVKEARLVVHVIKGENVPIRHEIIEEFKALKDGDGGGNRAGGNRQFRPTVNRPGNAGGDPNYDRQDSFEDDRANKATKTQEQLNNTPQVETYVEVKIQYHEKYSMLKTTNVDEGTMPRWNEILDFPLDSQNNEGFTQEELQTTSTLIIASLFDKQTYESVREGERVFLEEHRFLGSVTIPLQTLLANKGKTDFNFRLNRPICLPNYRVLEDEIYFMNSEQLERQRKMENEQPPTYLNLSITLEPNIELPSENAELFYPGFEEQKDLDVGTRWLHERLKTCKFKNANIKLFGENTKGQSVILCRYITPQQPPIEVVDLEQNAQTEKYAIERVARFVSMIPYIEDLRMFQDLPDLWTNSQEFFDLGGGDYEEHAIVLANYFRYIDEKQGKNYKSYIVLGGGLPNGHMVFVMRKRDEADGSFELWDPLTGQCYWFKNILEEKFNICGKGFGKQSHLDVRLTDPICPLRQIHTIVGSTNVWVNTQKSDYPILMNFDLTNVKSWKKFYNTDTDQITFQIPVVYSPPKENTPVIESRIQKYLIEMFQDERIKKVRKTTKWAVTSHDELRDILIDCEEWSKMARRGGIQSDLLQERQASNEQIDIGSISIKLDKVAQQDQNKRVWGFPLNATFTSLEQLWKMVQTTKLHAVNRQDVEFGMAVYIEPYPANILSVWIYLAAFVDIGVESIYN